VPLLAGTILAAYQANRQRPGRHHRVAGQTPT